MTVDITKQLRSMPDLQPPADGWQRLAARLNRFRRVRWRGGFAVAAAMVIAVVSGTVYWQQSVVLDMSIAEPAGQSVSRPVGRPIIVSAPAMRPDVRAAAARVRTLQQRSQQMERLLSGLPPRGRIASADAAGLIAELEDRIAAVDYQLNRTGLNAAGPRRPSSSSARRLPPSGGPRAELTQAPDLWQRRVEFMDQLVRARYAETAVNGY